jgi:predicted RNA-binding Zn-ribbon protein involved in translation (DUF1610 family)
MPHTGDTSERKTTWDLPPVESSRTAVQYFHDRDRKPVTLTLKFKLHNVGKWKTEKLLDAHMRVTNLTSRVLQHWAEDAYTMRNDGALSGINQVQEQTSNKLQEKQNAVSQGEDPPTEPDAERIYSQPRYQHRVLGEAIRKEFPHEDDDPLPGRIHEHVCRESAKTLLSWRAKLIRYVAEAVGKKRSELTLSEVYEIWRARQDAYDHAAAFPIPFGRNKGQPLGKFGKREARWLLERLLPETEINELIDVVERLLDDQERLIHGEIAFTPHPWQRDGHHHKSVRESYLFRHVFDQPGEPVLLGRLHKNELADLLNELREMKAYSQETHDRLQTLQGALVEARDVVAITDLRDALETVIYKKPPPYPIVDAVDLTDGHQNEREEVYQRWLNWFVINPERRDDAARFLNLEEETKHTEGLAKAAKALKPPKLQPLPFGGTMRPGQWRDFALLYDRQTYEYFLAVVIYRSRITDAADDEYQQQQSHPQRVIEQEQYRHRRESNPLYFVNFPETPFNPPSSSPVILFPLEYGFDYHDTEIVRNIIEVQRTAQRQKYEASEPYASISIEKSLPDARLKTARIICEWDHRGTPVFYAHVSIEMPEADRRSIPTRVIGISEHDDGYSYTVMELDGTVTHDGNREVVGDIVIPQHVDHARGAKPNTGNFIFEVANSIVSLADSYNAVIGIEDTKWMKQRPDLARDRNHQVFRRPSGRIMTTVAYKSQLSGLPDSYSIRDVSPVRDCGTCRQRIPKGQKTTQREWRLACPTCGTDQRLHLTGNKQTCSSCKHEWNPSDRNLRWELYFACPFCKTSYVLARHNRSTVVAQKLLIELNKHHRNAVAAESRRDKNKA